MNEMLPTAYMLRMLCSNQKKVIRISKNNNGEITTDVENLQSEDIADSSDALISECTSCPC